MGRRLISSEPVQTELSQQQVKMLTSDRTVPPFKVFRFVGPGLNLEEHHEKEQVFVSPWRQS